MHNCFRCAAILRPPLRFDSSRERKIIFTTQIGVGKVIKGNIRSKNEPIFFLQIRII